MTDDIQMMKEDRRLKKNFGNNENNENYPGPFTPASRLRI
jgi:hypothetical protein